MLADERAEVALPNRFAVVIESGEHEMLRLIPRDVNPLGIHGRSGRSETVELVPRERRQRKITLPNHFSIPGVNTEDRNPTGLVACAREKNLFAPQHGRRVPAARQFDFPVDVAVGDFGWNGFRVTDAGAIRPAKPRPFLRAAADFANTEEDDGQKYVQRIHVRVDGQTKRKCATLLHDRRASGKRPEHLNIQNRITCRATSPRSRASKASFTWSSLISRLFSNSTGRRPAR